MTQAEEVLSTERLETFSDGVIAIIITIMVLELRAPEGHTDFAALHKLGTVFLSYILSFIYLGIYWNNHHHMLRAAKRVTGAVMWANLHLLFWLSLVPFVTGWMGVNHFAQLPTAVYGVVLLMSAVAFTILKFAVIAADGRDSIVAKAMSNDVKGNVSLVIYMAAVGLAFVDERIAGALYVVVAIIWLVPDRRIERAVADNAVA